jgi:hypothetical protein
MPRANGINSHLAGEYFVAAELYRRGYTVAMTLGNAKAIDLFAERDGRTVNVQVKAIAKRQSVGWPMMMDKIIPGIVYVFVCLNEAPVPPDYFIATSDEARKKVKQYTTRGIVYLASVRSEEFIDRWDKIKAWLTSPSAPKRRRSRTTP